MRSGDAREKNELVVELEQLHEQVQQLQRMALIGELTSTATHEFNNLLMTILNYAKLGLRQKDEATRDKALQRILDAANRAAKVTAGLLLAARGKKDQMDDLDLAALAEDALVLIEREFRRFRVTLESRLDHVPEVRGNAGQLQQLLLNLLINARQATAEGGFVRVQVQVDEGSREVVLTVRDSGSGISPEVLPRIFEPHFSTKSGPDATGKGGAGLGLASCKEIVERHNGRIRVESSVGKGTAFVVRLPIAKSSALAG